MIYFSKNVLKIHENRYFKNIKTVEDVKIRPKKHFQLFQTVIIRVKNSGF